MRFSRRSMSPVELHYFYSERLGRELPFYASYSRRVRDLLTEIVAASGGNVILNERNPESFSAEEDRAVALGVQGIPVDQGGELVYFGLAGVNSVDDVVTHSVLPARARKPVGVRPRADVPRAVESRANRRRSHEFIAHHGGHAGSPTGRCIDTLGDGSSNADALRYHQPAAVDRRIARAHQRDDGRSPEHAQ